MIITCCLYEQRTVTNRALAVSGLAKSQHNKEDSNFHHYCGCRWSREEVRELNG